MISVRRRRCQRVASEDRRDHVRQHSSSDLQTESGSLLIALSDLVDPSAAGRAGRTALLRLDG